MCALFTFEIEPGVFEVSTVASMNGVYTFRVRANGTTLRDKPFTREQTVTGAVWRGGNDPLPTGDDDPTVRDEWLCRWLYCLLDGVISADLEKRLRDAGFDLEALRKCVKLHCRRRPQRGDGKTTVATNLAVGLRQISAAATSSVTCSTATRVLKIGVSRE